MEVSVRSLALKLQVVVDHHMGARNQAQVPVHNSLGSYPGTRSPAPPPPPPPVHSKHPLPSLPQALSCFWQGGEFRCQGHSLSHCSGPWDHTPDNTCLPSACHGPYHSLGRAVPLPHPATHAKPLGCSHSAHPVTWPRALSPGLLLSPPSCSPPWACPVLDSHTLTPCLPTSNICHFFLP